MGTPRRVGAPLVTFVSVWLVMALAGCAAPAPSPVPSPALEHRVVGVIVHVDATGLANVTGFTLRIAGGAELKLRIGTLENGTQFPPGHLAEHMATSDPVLVSYVEVGGERVVHRIEDGGPSPT